MSRSRKDVTTFFDVFCEVGADFSNGGAVILQKYPDDFNQSQTLKSITQFCFPCGLNDDDIESVQLFLFVLTDEKSEYTYAFCRHAPLNNTCLCILSGFFWSNIFYKMLNHISALMNNRPACELELLLTRIYHTPIPSAGEVLILDSSPGINKLELVIPDDRKLPTLKEDKFMMEFYNVLSEKQMITLYASLLKERRILFASRKLSQLSSCIIAASILIYPMQWQNIFIPVLPTPLVDMLMAPMPYLIGVPKRTLLGVKKEDLAGVVIIDLDQRTMNCPYNDLSDLPNDAVNFLRRELRSSSEMFLSDGLARAFLRTNAYIFGGYRCGIHYCSSKYVWDREKFVQNQRNSLKVFLRSLIGHEGAQYFERFIEERLTALNNGKPIEDDFENEARLYDEKTSKTSSHLGNPEVLHLAVSSVKENANDVLGAIKDKVQSIGVKNRISRLTSKEHRTYVSKKPIPNSSQQGSILSFDTQQWIADVGNVTDSSSKKNDHSQEYNEAAEDLIDLNDDTPSAGSSKSITSTFLSSPILVPGKLGRKSHTHHQSLEFLSLDPLFQQTMPSESKFNTKINSKGLWQQFD